MTSMPKTGTSSQDVYAQMEAARANDVQWRDGKVGLYVHFGGDDVLEVAKEAYLRFFSENALGPGAFPSLAKFETEVVAWTANLLNASEGAAGNISGGGTESIFLAMKSMREWARAHGRGGAQPIVVAPFSAHPAFTKAADMLGMRVVRCPLGEDFKADVLALRAAIDENTVGIMGSAPGFPHGVIDPIEAIAEIAVEHDLWMHVDACVGGFVLPFARALGHPIPPFDFSVDGVRSMSADLHKYGFAAKGASTVIYRDEESYNYQPYTFEDWPFGRYRVPTFAGSRPGGAVAAAWAVMKYLGRSGYERIVGDIFGARDELLAHLNASNQLHVQGDPQGPIVTYTSEHIDIYAVADVLAEKGWYIARGREPRCIHFGMITLMHVPVIKQYLSDLDDAVRQVEAGRTANGDTVASYGS